MLDPPDAKRQSSHTQVPTCLPLPPVRSGGFAELFIPGNTEQPCHLMPTRRKRCPIVRPPKVRAVRLQALPHTQCDGRETCLTATCSGVQLNADTPSSTPWTTEPLHRTPTPKPWRTLNSVQVSRTGIQEVSPRMFSGCPQVGPGSAPPDPPPAVGMTQVGRPPKRVSERRAVCPCGEWAAGASSPRWAR